VHVPRFLALCAVLVSMSQARCHEIGGGAEEAIKIIKKVDQLHIERLRRLRLKRWLRAILVKVYNQVDNLNLELFNKFYTI